MSADLLHRERFGPHLKIILNDPARQNALSPQMVAEIDTALRDSVSEKLSALIVAGAGGVFCAGADLKSLAAQLASRPAKDDNDPLVVQNMSGGRFFARFNQHPMLTIAVVDGAAIGGGMGLACCADVVIATSRARFALSETSLGIPPAQIAPYLVARLGERTTRRLALTGARLDAPEALKIGLADVYCEREADVAEKLEQLLKQVVRCAPGANAETKRLIFASRGGAGDAYVAEAGRSFARCVRGEEGQEGLEAFRARRQPAWAGRSK